MTLVFAALLLFAQTPAPTLDQIRTEPALERRAKLALEYSASAERQAEADYAIGDMNKVSVALKDMVAGMEIAQAALRETGKSPRSHPGPFKTAEVQSDAMLRRLGDLQRRMDADERPVMEAWRSRAQEIHDAWFDGIMSRKR